VNFKKTLGDALYDGIEDTINFFDKILVFFLTIPEKLSSTYFNLVDQDYNDIYKCSNMAAKMDFFSFNFQAKGELHSNQYVKGEKQLHGSLCSGSLLVTP